MTEPRRTDWDRYYDAPYKSATVTRRITAGRLIHAMRSVGQVPQGCVIAELGGANSCFFERVVGELRPREYHIVDNNQLGLDKFRERVGSGVARLHNADVLELRLPLQADLVFSVGLVEHFSPEDTARAIRSHFKILKRGGVAVITFPTPTWLYRSTRKAAELLGLWIFHDERPLSLDEVRAVMGEGGSLPLHEEIIWPIVLTQGLMVFRKA